MLFSKIKKIIINVGVMAILVVLMILGALWFLDGYTNHGSPLVEVENLEGVPVKKALVLLENAGLEGVVTDTIYKDGAKKLSVINQNPSAGLTVKPGRKVYLVINTNKVPMVMVPDLVENKSLDLATSILLRRHLKVGKVIKIVNESVKTKSDAPVLAQYMSGTTTPIKPGTLIERNSSIDLVIGISKDYYDNDSTANIPETE